MFLFLILLVQSFPSSLLIHLTSTIGISCKLFYLHEFFYFFSIFKSVQWPSPTLPKGVSSLYFLLCLHLFDLVLVLVLNTHLLLLVRVIKESFCLHCSFGSNSSDWVALCCFVILRWTKDCWYCFISLLLNSARSCWMVSVPLCFSSLLNPYQSDLLGLVRPVLLLG